jgi:expansin (peptidoglycan-binding protein)
VTVSRLLSPRRLTAGGSTLLAAVLGTVLLLQNGGSAGAAPPASSPKKGVATYFFLEGTLGNCSYPRPPADDLYVALGPDQYAGAASCGTYLDVTGPKGKVRVKVIDSCPECPTGHLDLSLTAFKRIANPVAGKVRITYRTVPGATTPGPISLRVQETSSRYWLSLLVDNHAHQLASVKIATRSTGFRTAHREQWNYWTIPSGLGNGPFRVKITDIYGRTVTVPHVKLAPGKTQKTSARLSGKPKKAQLSP